jgi:uncharacterized membrane protein YdfJ with MMPL/SSD domain
MNHSVENTHGYSDRSQGIILVIIFVSLLVALLRVALSLLRNLIPNAIFGLIILVGANLVGIRVSID